MKIARILLPLAALAIQGCRCGPMVQENHPDVVADPTALTFNACSSKDETGKPVADVSADRQSVSFTNNGRGPATLSYTIEGTGAAAFTVDTANAPTDLASLALVEWPVLFSPTTKDSARAELVIDDADETTEPLRVGLTGTVINRPAQPTFEAALERSTQEGQYEEMAKCDVDNSQNCNLNFPDSFVNESVVRHIKFRNKGCPSLKITSMEIVRRDPLDPDLAFFIETPATLPGASSPLVLSAADGSAETSFSIRFAPSEDPNMDVQRYGILKLTTNDPASPTIEIFLSGIANAPSVYTTPSFCDFANPNDFCGNTTKVANKAVFQVKNGGTGDIVIESANYGSSGNATGSTNGRFTTSVSVVGKTITAGGSETIEVTHNEMPLYVVDTIVIKARGGGQSAGSATISIAGGKKPCLETDPTDQLDFQNPTEVTTTKTIAIKNGSGANCGELVLNKLSVDANPFFTLVEPLIADGTRVQPGGSVEAHVQYKKPVAGGVQVATLRVQSNDTDYGPPADKIVRLYSQSPLDQIPSAVLTGCLPTNSACPTGGSTGSMSVRLSNLPGSPKTLLMSGKNSYDPGNATMPGISEWRFQLIRKPNGSMASITGGGAYTAMDSQTLTLDPTIVGSYQVYLFVKDDAGQQSTPNTLTINVTQ